MEAFKSGTCTFPINGGIHKLFSDVQSTISQNKQDGPYKVFLVSIHGWGPLDSRDVNCSNEMSKRLKMQIKTFIDPVIVYTMDVVNTGTTLVRSNDILEDLKKYPNNLSTCNLFLVVGHSQGAVTGLKVLHSLLMSNQLKHCRAGLISLAGVHGGTYEPVINPLRPATSELKQLGLNGHPETVMYQKMVNEVLSNNIRIMAMHSYGDNLVNVSSSTLSFINSQPQSSNLGLAIYIGQSLTRELSRPIDSWVIDLFNYYLRARNLGYKFHSKFATILNEADPHSTLASAQYPLDILKSWITTSTLNFKMPNAHSELVGCDLAYLYGLLWVLSSSTPISQPQQPAYFQITESSLLSYFVDQINQSEAFNVTALAPYAFPLKETIFKFQKELDNLVANKLFPLDGDDLKAYSHYLRMEKRYQAILSESSKS